MSQDSPLLIVPTQFVEFKFPEFKERRGSDQIDSIRKLPKADG